MYCSSCGSLIKDGQSFCANCGAPATKPAQPAVQPVQPAPQPAAQQVQYSQPVYRQPVMQVPAAAPVAPSESLGQEPVKKVPAFTKVFGWISIVMAVLAIIGMIMVMAASVMPSGKGVLIQAEDASKLGVLFIGLCFGVMLAPIGDITGTISLIGMLVSRNKKMIWLPITGIVVSALAFFGTIMALASSFEGIS